MNRHHITDFDMSLDHKNLIVNIRGTNGSGKSSVPLSMLLKDKDTFLITAMIEGKVTPIATAFPNFGFVAIGRYINDKGEVMKTGGLDTTRNTQQVKTSLELCLHLPYDIIMEGIIASTVFSTYANLFKHWEEHGKSVIIISYSTPVSVCLDRIQKRTGKPIKEDYVAGKHKTVVNNSIKFRDAGFNSVLVSNESISLDETYDWFMDLLDITVKERG